MVDDKICNSRIEKNIYHNTSLGQEYQLQHTFIFMILVLNHTFQTFFC